MAKLTAPIQEVSRLLDLVPYLSTHSHISLKELATEFNVTEKEMANELTALSMCGLPGYTPYELIEIFFDTGFVTINNHEALDIPRALTSLEVASLLIGLEILRDSAADHDCRVIATIDELIAQLRSLIGESIEVHNSESTAHLAAIHKAIASRQVVELNYLSPVKDELTIRTVDPLEVYVENGHTYLIAFCHMQNGQRNFRLDRIQSLTILATPASARTIAESKEEVGEVLFKVSGSERAIAELLGVSDIPRGGELAIEIFSPQWVRRAVTAYSPDLALLKPAQLRQEISSDLANILALYAP
ncbi:MAG: helix-turn-helix transcriptional regulator [Candidatus Planktophila sp.]